MAAVTGPRGDRALNRNSDPHAPWWHVDLLLSLATAALAAFGIAMVYSATRGIDPENYDRFYLERQGMFVIVGAGLAVGAAVLPYQRLRSLAPIVYIGGLLGVLAVLGPLGVEVNGAKAWLAIGSIQLQPSEFLKIGYIVMLAAYLARFDGEALSIPQLATALAIGGLPVLLIVANDFGTALVFVAITMGMLLIGGIRFRHIVILTLLGALAVGAVLNAGVLEDYQRDRLTSFIDPEGDSSGASFQQQQAQVAIGRGGLTGEGWGQGGQTRGKWVPEQQTDFIFTVVGEELGFAGAAAVLGLFAIMMWRIWRTAQLASEPFGRLICVGVLSMIAFQMFESVGMTTGIMPITGIPLPFISYGGSSILTSFVAIGLVVNVHMRRHAVAARSTR